MTAELLFSRRTFAGARFAERSTVCLLTGVTCIRLNLNTSLQSVHTVRTDVFLFSPHFVYIQPAISRVYHNLYGKIVFTCLFFGSLEFLVTRVRIECCVVFIVRL